MKISSWHNNTRVIPRSTIALKEVNHGKNGESRGLGNEIKGKKSENEKNESEKKKSEEKEHENNFEPSNKACNEVTMEDLKDASFPHRLTKARKVNLDAEIYDAFK